MKTFRIFLMVAMVLTVSGVNMLPQTANAWTPTLTSVAFSDFDHNGTIDRLKVTFDLAVTSCKFEAGDWAVGAGSIGLTAPTGRLNGVGGDFDCNGTTNYFYLLVSGDANETGYPATMYVQADLQYKNLGTLDSVTVSGVGAPTQPLRNVDDNASPVIISTVPTAGATGVSTTLSYIRVTFSEPMQTSATSLSISSGSWLMPAWSDGDKTVTRSRLTSPPYDTNITVSTSGEDLVGYLLSSGASPAITNPWSFRTGTDPALAVSASLSTVSASPTSVTADGSSVSVIIATIKNSSGSALSGKTVTVSSSRGATDTIAIVNGTTDASGKAYFQAHSNTPGSATFTAVADGVTVDQTASVVFTGVVSSSVSASRSSVLAIPASVVADGSSYSVVYVTVRDASDALLSGKTVTLSSNRGSSDAITIVDGTTNSSGQATFQVRSGATGTATLTAIADGVTISQTTTVTFTGTSTLVYGDLFKEAGSTAVYYYADNGKRYVFPTQAIYFSWYTNFSTIKTVSHTIVTSVPFGGNVLAKPGTFLVQFVSMDTPFRVLDPKVYVLTATGQLRWITSASVATSLYGADWEKKIIAVPEVYKTNYGNAVAGADVSSTADYSKVSVEATTRTISDLY
ncbi:Ig-like domain-containing protein [Candidatus Falkowbacteria bacterium]|nr:Ig-like domain-containing protein [Candidatus Falkowbacteria bacterium]